MVPLKFAEEKSPDFYVQMFRKHCNGFIIDNIAN